MKPLMIAASLMLALAWPAHAEEAAPSNAAAAQKENIFTVPLEAFKTSDSNPSRKLYVHADANLKKYHALQLEPLMFMQQSHEGQWELLQANENNEIANYFHAQMVKELKKAGVMVSDVAGPGVARWRIAVTGVTHDKPGLEVTDVLPIKIVVNVARMAADKELHLTKVGVLTQLDDSVNGQLLAGSADMRTGGKKVYKDEVPKLANVKSLIDKWCKEGAQLLAGKIQPNKS